ncbi:MAG: LysR substrate-binding domain-containing protein [Burkholderiaceae bacterium]|jgi:DNA-binding transcriptional LysR family regulator|nr:LysR substrate-binding domain-containing protein [Burkholderiaceae bacterium]
MVVDERSSRLRHRVGSRLKLRHLMLLQSLDQHRSLSRVAAEMDLSQPAITKALREIEDIFMTRLFERTSRGLTATTAGRAALRFAQVTLADVESTAQVLTAIDTGLIDRVRLGITPQVPEGLLNAAMTHLLGQSPRVAVLSKEGTTDELVAALSSREIDCAIARSFDHGVGAEIDQEPIYEQEPCLLVPQRSRARLSRGPLDWARLAALDWIFPPPNTPMRRTFSAIFLSAGVQPPSPVVETVSLRTIETALRHLPNGVTILPKDLAADLVQRGECAALPYKLTWNLPPVSFFVSRHMASHPTVRSLATAIRKAANSTAIRTR